MNAPHPTLTQENLAALRHEARAAGQSVVQRVQEQFGLDAEATLNLLATHRATKMETCT